MMAIYLNVEFIRIRTLAWFIAELLNVDFELSFLKYMNQFSGTNRPFIKKNQNNH